MQVILTRGLPASGKSTWAKQFAELHGYRRWNNDEFSYMVTGVEGPKSFYHMDGRMLGRMREAFIMDCLMRRESLIVDNTNLNPKAVRRVRELAKPFAVMVRVQDFTATVAECIRNDRRRVEFAVGEDVIRGMFEKFGHHYDWLKEE